jgi:uncharacterized protein YbjT (DUF2867 family)
MILLTGATGTTGLEVARALAARGVPFRAMIRDPDKAGALAQTEAALAKGDFADAGSMRRALEGVTRAFLLAPPVQDLHEVERPFVDAAKAAGVRQIVKLSAAGAAAGAPHRFGDWHGRGEDYLRGSGVAWTILRPSFFMQNLLGQAASVKAGTLYVPAGQGKAPFVDCRDIGAVAAACLAEGEPHAGRAYELTGPEALGYDDIAATLSKVLGRSVNYADVPATAAVEAMTRSGLPMWLAEALTELSTQMKLGRFAAVSDAVRRVAGRDPIRFEQFARDHAAAFA